MPGSHHHPTDASRLFVFTRISRGQSRSFVAGELGISHDTLQRHYKDEIRLGDIAATDAVASKLYELCMDGNLGAITFYLERRARWAKPKDDSTPMDEAPVFDQYTTEQLEQVRAILEPAESGAD